MTPSSSDTGRPFVGVDGTRGRWIAVALAEDGTFASAALVDTLAEVLETFPDARAYAVDVPIGLPEGGARAADLAAKMLLGPRRASVFPVPPLEVLQATTYAAARTKAVELTGKSLSAQSYALRHNIVEMHALIDSVPKDVSERIHEVHPELAFRALVGRVIVSSKRTWNGATERREALARVGLTLPTHLGSAGDVPVDDVLDAAVCGWSAKRIVDGVAECVPIEPVMDSRGRRVAIWF